MSIKTKSGLRLEFAPAAKRFFDNDDFPLSQRRAIAVVIVALRFEPTPHTAESLGRDFFRISIDALNILYKYKAGTRVMTIENVVPDIKSLAKKY